MTASVKIAFRRKFPKQITNPDSPLLQQYEAKRLRDSERTLTFARRKAEDALYEGLKRSGKAIRRKPVNG